MFLFLFHLRNFKIPSFIFSVFGYSGLCCLVSMCGYSFLSSSCSLLPDVFYYGLIKYKKFIVFDIMTCIMVWMWYILEKVSWLLRKICVSKQLGGIFCRFLLTLIYPKVTCWFFFLNVGLSMGKGWALRWSLYYIL